MKNVVRCSIIIAIIGLSILVRIALFPLIYEDLVKFVIPWFDFLIDHGGFQALNYPFFNYSPPYQYFLAASSNLHKLFDPLELLKIISIVFDFIAAWTIFSQRSSAGSSWTYLLSREQNRWRNQRVNKMPFSLGLPQE